MAEKPAKKQKEEEKEFDYDFADVVNSVASATECTGLMYLPPQDEDEAENYADIYSVPTPQVKQKREYK